MRGRHEQKIKYGTAPAFVDHIPFGISTRVIGVRWRDNNGITN